jgi:hypothetical protein
MDIPFSSKLPFRCKNGGLARLVGVIQNPHWPLVVAVEEGSEERVYLFSEEGKGENGGDLENTPIWEEVGEELHSTLKRTDFVHAVALRDLEPMNVLKSSNPFEYDLSRMGSFLVCGWWVMHSGHSREEPLNEVILINSESGQRIHIGLRQKKPR